MPDMYIPNMKATGQGMRVYMSSTLHYYNMYMMNTSLVSYVAIYN